MSSLSLQNRASGIAADIGSLRLRGIQLWLEDGKLRFKAPRGALSDRELEKLRASKNEIVRFLSDTPGRLARGDSTRGLSNYRAPLAFSQLAHWQTLKSNGWPFRRTVASATRLHGALRVDALERALREIERRHDALRTQIVLEEGDLKQEISNAVRNVLRLEDLTRIPRALRENEVARYIDSATLTPIDLATDPLYSVQLLKLAPDEHVLIVAMEHIISDAFSMNIFMRELSLAYSQAVQGRTFELPEVQVQFAEYASLQSRGLQTWIERHWGYWRERLAACGRLRFPADKNLSTGRAGWSTVPLRIDRDLKAELAAWCRKNRSTLVLAVFATYAATVLRWCDVGEAIFPFQTDARVNPKAENTIGYFASMLYLRIELCERDRFVDVLRRVTDQYCGAYEHADFSYIDSLVPPMEFKRNGGFNWVPRKPPLQVSPQDSETELRALPFSYQRPLLNELEWDSEPYVLFFETEVEISGTLSFPLSRFTAATMERFARNFLLLIQSLLHDPETRLSSLPMD